MALDTFNPYLFVSAGEQSNKFLTPTYAGGIAQFQAQRAQSLTGLTVRIDPIQEGTGDPSPDNIRPISGRTGMTVTVQSGETQNEYPVTWQTEAGTVYGGTLDVVSGVLTVYRAMANFDGSNDEVWSYYSITTGNLFRTPLAEKAEQIILSFPENYACNSYRVAANSSDRVNGTFSGYGKNVDFVDDRYSTLEDWRAALAQTPIQFVYPLATPQTYQFTGAEVRTIAGFNQIYSDAGPIIDIKF